MLTHVKKIFTITDDDTKGLEERENALARIYCLLGAVLTPFYTVITFGNHSWFDFFCLSAITLFFLLGFAFSSKLFKVKIIRENLSNIALGIYLFISAYAVYAAYQRSFAVDYSFGLTILFFLFGIVLKSVRQIIIYFSVTAFIGSIALFMVKMPQVSAPFLVSFFLIFFCVGFFALRYKAGIRGRLEQRENFLKSLFNQTYDAILLVDFYSRVVVDCNEAAVNLYHVTDKNEIIGHKRDKFEEHKMNEAELVQCRRELAQNGIWRNETSFITKKQKQFWGEIVITPLNIGNTQYYVARINDITPQRIAKEALRENEERYRTIFKLNPQPIWIYDRNTLKFIDVNDEAVRHYGYSHGEFLNMTVLDVRPDEEKKRLLEHLEKTGTDDVSIRYTGDWKHRKKDGTVIDVEIVRTRINLNSTEANIALIKDVTEIRKIESALRESEERFKLLSELTTEAIAIHEKGKILEVNAAFCNLFGYREQEAIGMSAAEMATPQSREIVISNIIKNYEKPYEATGLRKDGSTFIGELVGKTIHYKGRDARVTIIRDITEQRKAENELRESRERLNNFMNSATDVFAVYDENLNLVKVNDAGIKMIKVSDKNQIIGKNITEIFPGIEKSGRIEKYREVLRTGKSARIEDFRADYKAEEIYLVVIAFKVGNELGIIARDVTERRKTERQIRDSEKSYRDLVELSPDGIIIIIDEQIVYANPMAYKLFGVENNEKLLKVEEIILPEHHPSSKERRDRALKGENVPFAEIKIKRADGKIIEVDSKPIGITYYGCKAVLVELHDSSQTKELERERTRAELAEEVGKLLKEEINERLKIEKQLTESQKYTRKLIDSSLDMICASDIEGKIIEFNSAALKTFGYSAGEIIGKPVTVLYADLKEQNIIHNKLLEGDGIFSGEITNMRKNGERFISYLSASVLKDENGTEFGFMGVSRDITENKKAENELRQSEEKFRALSENAPVLIMKISRDAKVQYINRVQSFKKEDVIGSSVYNFIHKDAVPMYKQHLNNVFTTGEVVSFEVQGLRADKTMGWYSTRLAPIRGKSGIDSMVLITSDITESKNAELKLKQSEERYRDLFENATDLIQSVDGDGKILFVNKAWKNTLGYSEEEMGDKIIFDFIHPDCVKHCMKVFEKISKGETIRNIEIEYITKSGKKIIVNGNISARYENKKLISTRGIFRDVTESKQAEELIIKSLREKEVLLKEVHHRVKNNMQVISSILNLQSAYVKDKNTVEILKESQNRIKTMAFIHESLYQENDFSKIDFSEYILNLSKNLMYSYQSFDNSTELKLDLKENILLNIDQAIPCGLIINELVSNAFKHAFPNGKKGIVNLKLKKEATPLTEGEKQQRTGERALRTANSSLRPVPYQRSGGAGGLITLEVSDNGLGMAKNIDYKNTETLGLQLVSTLVEQLDATMKMENKKGTKFIISFIEKTK